MTRDDKIAEALCDADELIAMLPDDDEFRHAHQIAVDLRRQIVALTAPASPAQVSEAMVELRERYRQYMTLSLPGQPLAAHVGSVNLVRDLMTALESALSLPAQEWRVIEEAEPNTDLILGWWEEWPTKKWKTEIGYAQSAKGGWLHGQATHWQPLPSPPAGDR